MLYADEYNSRRQQEREDMIIQAYLTAAWHRTKKMPRLEKVLEENKPKTPTKPQTPEQMFAITKRMFEGKEV